MSTYSYIINPGSPTEAYKLNTLQDVMDGLPDNLEKLVSPHDLRNATFTIWENILLKETIISGLTYTGYNDFPGQTISQKIYLGKKQRSGLDIMTDTLLNSDTDLFFYNNKKDSNTSQNTKISILAGTTVSNFSKAPYIEARQVISPSSIDLYIINPGASSKIVIDSPTVNIKDLNYPSAISGSPNQLLRHNGAGSGMWASPTVSSIIAPGVTVSIVGSPVLVNGYSLEYTNSFPSQITVGGISVGTSFATISFVDMFNKLFYPYLVPIVSLTASVLVYEYGSIFIPQLFWNIQSKTNAVTSATLSGVISPIIAPPIIPAMTTVGGTLTSINITTTNPTATWVLSAFDGTSSSTTSITANRVYPFFYGMSSNNSLAGVSLYTSLTKDVSGWGTKTYTYTGNNKYAYFVYPVSYGLLTQIQDQNLNTVYSGGSGSFTYSIIAVSSTALPNNWSTNFYAYKTTTLVSNYGYPFTFIF